MGWESAILYRVRNNRGRFFRTFLAARFFGTFQRFQGPARGHRRTGKATLGRLVNPPLLVNPPVIPGQGQRGPAKEKEKRRVTADMNRELSLETGRGGRWRSQSLTSETTSIFDCRAQLAAGIQNGPGIGQWGARFYPSCDRFHLVSIQVRFSMSYLGELIIIIVNECERKSREEIHVGRPID